MFNGQLYLVLIQSLLLLEAILQFLNGLHLLLKILVVLLDHLVAEDQVLLSRLILPKLYIRVRLFLDFFQGDLDVVPELDDHRFEVFPLDTNRVMH